MATNDSDALDDDHVVIAQDQHTDVYHTNRDCQSVNRAEQTREIPTEQADRRGLSLCEWCGGLTTTGRDMSVYQAAKEHDAGVTYE
ncbi:hypothetical protein OSG_eHP3_00050 [environmental Halophage eHP-3]|nr:hypothetical protein OSG_eHP3_00050 [environmental Halophage eHP-3]